MNRFRPPAIPKALIFKQRLAYGRSDNYNWQSRVKWIPAGYKINRQGILRRWQEIHHYAIHAPWCLSHYKTAQKMFHQKFLGSTGKASVRYLNTYSAHSWL
jgi:hypothetical protein